MLADFVHPLRRSYEDVRLPANVHVGITAFCLLRPSHSTIYCGRLRGLPVLAHGASTHAQGLRLRSVKGPLALFAALHVAFPLSGQGRHAVVVISELDTWPVCSSVNASPAALRPPAHDSGPKWCATPFLCGSLIRYSMPVYPGAFPNSFFHLQPAVSRMTKCRVRSLEIGFDLERFCWDCRQRY
jgi:hypothetical protein